jgi:ATP-dependent exoDNAse (exonuclease V) beta subunit
MLTHSYSAIKLFENCPLRYYRQRVTKEVKDEDNEYTLYGSRIHKALENKLAKQEDLPKDMQKYEPLCDAITRAAVGGDLLVEYQMTLNGNLEPTGWFAKDAWLRSVLDVLVVKNDRAIVLDWKTGKRRPDFFQMQIFAAQVFKVYPDVTTVDTSLVWLQTMAQDQERFERKDANLLWRDILGRIKRIELAAENDTWTAKPSGLCKFCPCRHDCEYF